MSGLRLFGAVIAVLLGFGTAEAQLFGSPPAAQPEPPVQLEGAQPVAPSEPQRARPRPRPAPSAAQLARARAAERANAGAISILAGGVGGTHARMAADIAAVLDDGDRLRILPVLGKGSRQNLRDMLLLRGMDMALVQSDAIENAGRDPELGDLGRQVAFVARLHNEELHIVARADITHVSQLAGKRVNIDLAASGTAATARLLFERLGIAPDFVNLDQQTALGKLRSGEIDANLFIGGKPLPAIAEFRGEGRFRLLPLPYDPRLQDAYFPAELSASDYPHLVAPGQSVETIAVATLLVVIDRPPGTEGHQRLARFVDAFFSKLDEFSRPGRHPKWQEVNLSATAPGWRRFRPAQDWLDRAAVGAIAGTANRDDVARFLRGRRADSAPRTAQDEERLAEEFRRWQQRNRPAQQR